MPTRKALPYPFKVVHDTIYIYSNEPVAYKIDRQTEYSFWFHSLADEVIKLHKSENAEDSFGFHQSRSGGHFYYSGSDKERQYRNIQEYKI